VWRVKADTRVPFLFAAAIATLLSLRLVPRVGRRTARRATP
jgi:hypothetical protein